MRDCLWALLLFCGLVAPVTATDEPKLLHVLGRSAVEGYQVQLDEKDWQWLRSKRVLRLGVSGRTTRRSRSRVTLMSWKASPQTMQHCWGNCCT